MNNWCVYKHESPNGKIYIGITKQKPENRWLCGHGYKTNTHFYNAIKKYGWNNIQHEIIESNLTQEQAETLERILIFQYKSYDKEFGYNKALGGHALSEESRRQIGDTRRRRGYTSWTKGKHLSQSTKDKISAANKGNDYHTVWTEEQKESVRQSKLGANNPNYGKPMDEILKRKLTDLNSKPVRMIVGSEIKTFSSAAEASRMTGITASNISRVCNGIRNTAGGYVWEFA